MNVGPSVHHADFFGLHSHCGADSSIDKVSSSQNLDIFGSGCCCEHHQVASPPASQSENLAGNEETLRADDRCSDCLFCQYFDHLYAVNCSTYFDLEETPSCDSLATPVEAILFRPIACSARGPPAIFLS